MSNSRSTTVCREISLDILNDIILSAPKCVGNHEEPKEILEKKSCRTFLSVVGFIMPISSVPLLFKFFIINTGYFTEN